LASGCGTDFVVPGYRSARNMFELIPCAVCSTRAYIGQIRTLFVPRALMNILPVSASMRYRYRKSRVLDNEYAIGMIKIEEGDAIHIITLRFDSDEDKWILTVPISSNTIQIFKSTSFHGVFLRLFYDEVYDTYTQGKISQENFDKIVKIVNAVEVIHQNVEEVISVCKAGKE